MNNSQGSAIYCPTCTYARDGALLHQILGSITTDGKLLIKRAHNLLTVIHVLECIVACDCGYQQYIKVKSPGFKQPDYDPATN